ncbi:TlpA disulfide reductase family protein [Nonomuraea candida]|uniref:TlpA disulfide reductase family protein n=1 Tax=Nonomuraea candida TaxID=359159 RepID=UPI001FE1C93C|nr:TlpA disulfide reductase family protein [Nonomuraea candida]
MILVGALCLLDLLLTLGVIRRLREHDAHLRSLLPRGDRPPAGPPVPVARGERVGDFLATTVDGEPVSRDLLTGETLVAFFSPGCTTCKGKLPEFAAYVRDLPGGRDQVIAVVADERAEIGEMSRTLAPLARVVVEEFDGELSRAFGVDAFPAHFVVDGSGTLLATAPDLALLRSARNA